MATKAKQQTVFAAVQHARQKAANQAHAAEEQARRNADERARRRAQESVFRERDHEWMQVCEHRRENAWALRGGNAITDPNAEERARLQKEIASSRKLVAAAVAAEMASSAEKADLKATLESWGRFTPRGSSAVKMRGEIARAEARRQAALRDGQTQRMREKYAIKGFLRMMSPLAGPEAEPQVAGEIKTLEQRLATLEGELDVGKQRDASFIWGSAVEVS